MLVFDPPNIQIAVQPCVLCGKHWSELCYKSNDCHPRTKLLIKLGRSVVKRLKSAPVGTRLWIPETKQIIELVEKRTGGSF